MRVNGKMTTLLNPSLAIRLFLWLFLCLIIYVLMPNRTPLRSQLNVKWTVKVGYNDTLGHLVDLRNFDYLIKQPPCKAHKKTLIMVHSAPLNIEKRSVIRETWGGKSIINPNSTFELYFLLGHIENATIQRSLEEEHALHGDLLQGNFGENYYNLTYKHVMALKWFNTNCGQAQLLIKVDDDIYLNTPKLMQLQQSNRTNETFSEFFQEDHKEFLFCARRDKAFVTRSFNSKWRVSFQEYAEKYYPPFCPGFTIFYSPNVADRLYQAAQAHKFYRLDDVLVTGILAKRCNIAIEDLTPYVLYPNKLDPLLKGRTDPRKLEFLTTHHKMTTEQSRKLWQLYGIKH